MRRGLILGALVSLFSISFTSALLSDTLSFIDPSFITIGLLFVILFALINFSLSKMFKGNPAVSIVISISISLLAVYWLNTLLSFGAFFSDLGISDEILYTIGPILFLALVIFLFVKLRFGVFVVLGGILILGALTGLVYSGEILTIIGIVLVIIGFMGMFSKGGRMFFLLNKLRRLQRRYGQNDPRVLDLKLKISQKKPGFAGIKP